MQLMFVKHFEDIKLYRSTNVEKEKKKKHNRPNYLFIKEAFSDLLMEMQKPHVYVNFSALFPSFTSVSLRKVEKEIY